MQFHNPLESNPFKNWSTWIAIALIGGSLAVWAFTALGCK